MAPSIAPGVSGRANGRLERFPERGCANGSGSWILRGHWEPLLQRPFGLDRQRRGFLPIGPRGNQLLRIRTADPRQDFDRADGPQAIRFDRGLENRLGPQAEFLVDFPEEGFPEGGFPDAAEIAEFPIRLLPRGEILPSKVGHPLGDGSGIRLRFPGELRLQERDRQFGVSREHLAASVTLTKIAGIEFATRLQKTPKSLDKLAKEFRVSDYAPDIAYLNEATFKKDFGSTTDPRYKEQLQDLRKRVAGVKAYGK